MCDSAMLLALMAVPLVASALMLVLPSRRVPGVVFEGLNVASSAVVCVTALGVSVFVVNSAAPLQALGLWFCCDALSCVFVCLIGVIGLVASLSSVPYIRHDVEQGRLDAKRVKIYYVFFQLFVASMLIAVLSNNIVLMWVGIELTTLVGAVLVGIYHKEGPSLEAGWKYLIICTAGVAFGILGIMLVSASAQGAFDTESSAFFWSELIAHADACDQMLLQAGFACAIIGFGTKAGLFPLHTWLPDAHSEAPAPVSAMLSGVLLKCAILAIIRFDAVAIHAGAGAFASFVLLVFGAITVCFAAFAVYAQTDLKRKLAYSSCENVGLIVLCLGFGGPVGIAVALLHCVFHGLTKALMFCLSGNVIMRYGTRDTAKLEGIAKAMPVTGVLMGAGLLALSGMPPFAMFLSEVFSFVAGVQSGLSWLVVIIGLALTVVIAAFVRVLVGCVAGKAPGGMKRKDVSAIALVPQAILLGIILWFGIAMPQTALLGIEQASVSVSVQDAQELHQSPFVKDLFSNTQQSQLQG